MKTTFVALIAAAVMLGTAGNPARGQFRPVGRPAVVPSVPLNRPGVLPGSDWWRIYPWSPYNAWRNPYWYPPYNPDYPYPPPQAGPVIPPALPYGTTPPYYEPSVAAPAAVPDGIPSEPHHVVLMPHPTGALSLPPPGAALILVRIPDFFGTVWFDGEKCSSLGTNRYYVTPELPSGKEYRYVVASEWNGPGGRQKEERRITVAPGRTTTVDFNRRPAPSP